jgi:ABC-2 type transport system permease protein
VRGLHSGAAALAFGAFWFALSAAVIVRNGGSATHAVTRAAAWLALTMLLPAAINLAVKTLAPVPSRVELILAMRDATDAAVAERSKLLGAFYEDHPELTPASGIEAAANDFVMLRLITEPRVNRELAPVLALYQEQLARQQALSLALDIYPKPAAQSHNTQAKGDGSGRLNDAHDNVAAQTARQIMQHLTTPSWDRPRSACRLR